MQTGGTAQGQQGKVWLASATQVDLFRKCQRAWAFAYLGGLKEPKTVALTLGSEVDDEQIQPYLREGRPFDMTRAPLTKGYNASGYIAASMRRHLPAPRAPGMRIQRHFVLPSPSSDAYGWQGYQDIWVDDSRAFPALADEEPSVAVGDTKTSSDIAKWALTEGDDGTLSTNVQAMLYAMDALFTARDGLMTDYSPDRAYSFRGRPPFVWLAWVYGQSKGPALGETRVFRATEDHVAEQFMAIDATTATMHAALTAAPPKPRVALPGALPPALSDYVHTLPATRTGHCRVYGKECIHSTYCKRTPAELGALFPKEQTMAIDFNAIGSLNLGGTVPAPAAPTPAAAQSAAEVVPAPPAQLPAWATAPVDPIKAKVEEIRATAPSVVAPVQTRTGAAGGVTQPPPAWAADPKGVPGAVPVAPSAALVPINPPEAALPPVVETVAIPPVPAVQAADEGAKPKRHRRTKAEIEADRAARVAAGEDPDAPIPYAVAPSAEAGRVAWGVERYSSDVLFPGSKLFSACEVGPFDRVVVVAPGETVAEAYARTKAELQAFAEAERKAKLEAFAASIEACIKGAA